MKKQLYKLSMTILSGALLLTGCDTVDFGDTNVDPNNPSNAASKSLFTNAQKQVSGFVGSATSNMYVQYLANGQYPEEGQYQTLNWSPDAFYAAITDLRQVVTLNTDEDTKVGSQAYGSNANQIATAMILEAWFVHGMTDRWGMLPYSEALQGLDNSYPKYDSQEEIYMALFQKLDDALAMIDGGNGPTGDIMMGGNMTQWRRFANTIKMVMALRLSKADPATGQAKFNEAYMGGLQSNADNVMYNYLTEDTNDNPWQDRFESRRDYVMSDVLVDAMVGTGTSMDPEDPRLPMYADPAINHPGEYLGGEYGVANNITDDFSYITSNIIFTGDAPLMVYTYSEVLFARAEAAYLGWTGEDPAALYGQAIVASMEQWGVPTADAQTYVTNNPYAGPEDIAFQKWISLFLQGYNSWAEWRRHTAMGYGVPLTPPDELLSNATGIPQRHAYSATADALNKENYDAAVAAQGPDDLNTILWTNK